MSETDVPRGRHTAPLAQIERFEQEGVRVVVVRGELDISNVAELEDATLDLPGASLGIVLDLTHTTYMDSATLGLAFKLQRGLQRQGQALRLVCKPGSSAQRLLELTGFDRDRTCERDVEAAIMAIRHDVLLRG